VISNTYKIGGEFEINPNDLLGFPNYIPKSSITLFSNGRSALQAILCQIKTTNPSVIHIPYYICPSVVNACVNKNFRVQFYELDANFSFPFEYLDSIKQNETLLSVNYFGFIDINPLINLVKDERPDIIVINDQVHSIWVNESSRADYSFTSFRKHFPISEGAKVFSKNSNFKFDSEICQNSFFWPKLVGSLLKYYQAKDNIYLKFFEDGENELNATNGITKASALGYYLYENADLEQIKKKRKENYKFLYDMGSKYGINFLFPYNEKVIPLCVPIILENRDKIKSKLLTSNIYLPVHWPLENYNNKSMLSTIMSQKELSLVIDQRYSFQDMELEIKTIIK